MFNRPDLASSAVDIQVLFLPGFWHANSQSWRLLDTVSDVKKQETSPNLTQMEWTVAVHNVHKDTNFLEDPIRYANFIPKKPRRKVPVCHNPPLDCCEKQVLIRERCPPAEKSHVM